MKTKIYDLEERTFTFTKNLIELSKRSLNTYENDVVRKQLIRSGSSVGANYIEANESFSKKDFIYRIKICKKEAKETRYWLRLIDVDDNYESLRNSLIREAEELQNILGAIYHRSVNSNAI